MTVIDTPDGIEHFQFARCIAALRIEVSTGMTMSRGVSMLKVVQSQFDVKAKTRKAALAELEDKYEAKYGRRYGS